LRTYGLIPAGERPELGPRHQHAAITGNSEDEGDFDRVA
jgi:hypothetical protein